MNFMTPISTGATNLALRLRKARRALKPPPRLNLVEWADRYRYVSLSSSPGKWKTKSQPIAFGPMMSLSEKDTVRITVMSGTQLLKSEFLKNVCYFYIHQEPSPILFVQPSQRAAADFSKERFAPDIRKMPEVAEVIHAAKSRENENTIIHKEFPGGPLDFVGANAPNDLASRPKRIILCDEIDKYPVSAGDEGDPLKLAEERASTYEELGLAKFVRVCSPTEEGKSRIGREYAASDQRRCYVACPHCGTRQVLTWANIKWEKVLADGTITIDVPEGAAVREHRPNTAQIMCADCGTLWSERDRLDALASLEKLSDYGWRQTATFFCCEEAQTPETWSDTGRSLCKHCHAPSAYEGHAGFHISKIYSARHRLSTLVREFLGAKGDPELLKKFTNTGLAELWKPTGQESLDGERLIDRVEAYGPDDLPDAVKVITGFCDVQGDRLEVQLVGWGDNEESWPFLYEIIHQDPAQPAAWKELDDLLGRQFRTGEGRILRIAAFGIDTGGHHGAQVHSFCRRRKRRRVFACMGNASKPLWSGRATRSRTNDPLWFIGTNAAKDTIYARLRIQPPEGGGRKPGLIHFPIGDGFGPEYFAQLTSEVRQTRRRMGQAVTVWMLPQGKRNEALDTFVGALAVRRSLPRTVEASLEFRAKDEPQPQEPTAEKRPEPVVPRKPAFIPPRRPGWLSPRR